MKAMILAAGIGSRMGRLTKDKPKALISLNQIPILEHVIRRLITAGVSEIIINVHHFADQIVKFIQEKNNFDIRIEFSREDKLLDTGGGLKNAQWFFDDHEPFILHNVDIISEIDMKEFSQKIKKSDALAILAVRKRLSTRQLLFDDHLRLMGWKSTGKDQLKIISNRQTENLQEYAFLGIHVISPDLLKLLPRSSKFSIINAYLQISSRYMRIFGSVQNKGFWLDVGTPGNIEKAEALLK